MDSLLPAYRVHEPMGGTDGEPEGKRIGLAWGRKKAASREELCPYCGIVFKIEREVFSRDRFFTGHSCRGGKEE